jgi:hypothetical protein
MTAYTPWGIAEWALIDDLIARHKFLR